MRPCPTCGHPNVPEAVYCANCGLLLVPGNVPAQSHPVPGREVRFQADRNANPRPCLIPLSHIALLTFLSFGLYPIYWFYITWKHCRDYTGDNHYPVWHALTLLVPIYMYFRIHAHGRTYRQIQQLDQPPAPKLIDPWIPVFLVLAEIPIYIATAILTVTNPSAADAISNWTYLPIITLHCALILYLQNHINRIWLTRPDRPAVNTPIGKGAIILCVIGVQLWIGNFAA